MRKSTRNILITVVIVILAFIIILAVYNNYKTEPIDANSLNTSALNDANTGLGKLIGILNEENIENNEKTNDVMNDTSSNSSDKTSSSNDSDNEVTRREKKAVELAKAEWKKEWGDLDDVSFNYEMIQGDGKYVVAVRESKTTTTIRFYVVDISTGLVEER